jgi:hypothetical protein
MLSGLNETYVFWTDLRKNSQISNFVKIPPVGTELFHANRWPKTTEIMVVFRYFAKEPQLYWAFHNVLRDYKHL